MGGARATFTYNARQGRWLFGDHESGAYVHKLAWTKIFRAVGHGASLDDPTLAGYWGWRRRKVSLPLNKTFQELIDAKDGRCVF